MADLELAQIYQWIAQYFFPFCRIAAFFTVLPIFSTQLVPVRIRLGLAVATTVIMAPVIDPVPVSELMTIPSFLIILQEILIGLVIGFVIQLLFQVFFLQKYANVTFTQRRRFTAMHKERSFLPAWATED